MMMDLSFHLTTLITFFFLTHLTLSLFTDQHNITNNNNPGYKTSQDEIKPSLYEKAHIADVVQQCEHLTPSQQQDLYQFLSKYETLFLTNSVSTRERKSTLSPISSHITLMPMKFSSPIPTPSIKQELDHFIQIGVLGPCSCSEWRARTFIITRKDGQI